MRRNSFVDWYINLNDDPVGHAICIVGVTASVPIETSAFSDMHERHLFPIGRVGRFAPLIRLATLRSCWLTRTKAYIFAKKLKVDHWPNLFLIKQPTDLKSNTCGSTRAWCWHSECKGTMLLYYWFCKNGILCNFRLVEKRHKPFVTKEFPIWQGDVFWWHHGLLGSCVLIWVTRGKCVPRILNTSSCGNLECKECPLLWLVHPSLLTLIGK